MHRALEHPEGTLSARLTVKGQVTIPAPVRTILGVRPHDKIAFVVEDDQVRLKRSESIVRSTAGAFRSDRRALSARQLRQKAEEAIAEDGIKRSE
jgi:AbrB family looped-hinge helix DNA binding protein